MAKFDRKLGSILVKNGKLSPDGLNEAIKWSTDENKSLAAVLVEHELLDERDIIGTVSAEVNIPPVDLERVEIPEEVLAYVDEELARYYHVLPLSKIGNILTIATANPFDVVTFDDVKLATNCELQPVISTDRAIAEAINKFYNRAESEMKELLDNVIDPDVEHVEKSEEEEDLDVKDLADGAKDAPVIKLVNLVIYQAIKAGASDIHIEPYEHKLRVRYRIDGICKEQMSPPKKLQNAIVSRLKIMSELDIAERRRPQDGKFQMKLEGRQVDFRVSVLPTVHGEKVVMRILDASSLLLSLEQLGFEEKALKDFQVSILAPYGMVLVTGPTGSGKTTTLYSAIRQVMNPEINITTVEDPVEYQLEGVNQVNVNVKRGLTFGDALRSILRQDPDVILIGEIRDLETIEIAVKAALTGHLVFSTLHTNDAPATITRMVDMGVDPFMIASSTLLVSAQRLGRKLCEACKQPVSYPRERLLEIGFMEKDLDGQIYGAKGCPVCSQLGYKGRFALLETMPMTDSVRRVVIGKGSALDIKDQALKEGMITLRRVGIMNIQRGRTSVENIVETTLGDS